MAVRTIIPGPPGTGKTYRLVNHYLSNEINGLQTNPKKINSIKLNTNHLCFL